MNEYTNNEATGNGMDAAALEIAVKQSMDLLAVDAGLPTYTEIEKSKANYQRWMTSSNDELSALRSKVEKVRAYLVKSVGDDDLEPEIANDIADLLDIELMEQSVMTLTIKVTVNHKIGKRDNLDESDLNISIDNSWSGGDIDEVVDWECDGLEVEEA